MSILVCLTPQWVPLHWHDGRQHESNLFSEENNGYSDLANGPIFNMLCRGDYCDNKKFFWMVYRGSINIFKEHGHWSGWFSNEQSGYTCDPGKAVRQIQCNNHYCDNMRLLCAGLKDGFRVNNAATSRTDWFSGENGWRYCDNHTSKTHWLVGIGCRGYFCHDVQLRCALIERRGTIGDEPSLEALPENIIA